MPLRLSGRLLVVPLLAGSLVSLVSCAGSPATEEAGGASEETNGWVVVVYEDRPNEFDGDLMEALLETELAADQALAQADAGWIDGNDVGDSTYELYFVGEDAELMWNVLEPVFSKAPVAWTRVELRNGLEDPAPTLLNRD